MDQIIIPPVQSFGGSPSSGYITTENSRINTSTLEEIHRRITPEFPYMTDLCQVHNLPGRTFPWHWHSEVEIF